MPKVYYTVVFARLLFMLLFVAPLLHAPAFAIEAGAEATRSRPEVSNCESNLKEINVDKFEGMPYRVIRKAKEWTPEYLYPDYSPNDIFIGFSAGHTYFHLNGYRYDGGLAGSFVSTKIRIHKDLNPGVILRIKDAPKEAVELLTASLKGGKEPVSLTCSQGVCSFLKTANFDIPASKSFVPSLFLKNLLQSGIKMKDGRTLQFDLTVLGIRSIERSLVYSRLAEAAVFAVHPIGIATGIGALGVVGIFLELMTK